MTQKLNQGKDTSLIPLLEVRSHLLSGICYLLSVLCIILLPCKLYSRQPDSIRIREVRKILVDTTELKNLAYQTTRINNKVKRLESSFLELKGRLNQPPETTAVAPINFGAHLAALRNRLTALESKLGIKAIVLQSDWVLYVLILFFLNFCILLGLLLKRDKIRNANPFQQQQALEKLQKNVETLALNQKDVGQTLAKELSPLTKANEELKGTMGNFASSLDSISERLREEGFINKIKAGISERRQLSSLIKSNEELKGAMGKIASTLGSISEKLQKGTGQEITKGMREQLASLKKTDEEIIGTVKGVESNLSSISEKVQGKEGAEQILSSLNKANAGFIETMGKMESRVNSISELLQEKKEDKSLNEVREEVIKTIGEVKSNIGVLSEKLEHKEVNIAQLSSSFDTNSEKLLQAVGKVDSEVSSLAEELKQRGDAEGQILNKTGAKLIQVLERVEQGLENVSTRLEHKEIDEQQISSLSKTNEELAKTIGKVESNLGIISETLRKGDKRTYSGRESFSMNEGVYKLKDMDYTDEEIARKLGIGKGEVELILNLRKSTRGASASR